MDPLGAKAYPVRKAHTLHPTKSVDRPKRVIFFDTETSQVSQPGGAQLHHLKLGVAKATRSRDGVVLKVTHTLKFRQAGEFWAWVDERCHSKTTTYLVAHNLTFDLAVTNAFQELARGSWRLESWYSKGLTSIFRWRCGERRLVGLDNGNFFVGSLEKWGRIVGAPKMDVDPLTASDDELWPYCERDVDIMVQLWHTWLAFLDEHQCGSFKPTLSSTAFNTWRHRFMGAKVHIHANQEALDLERQAYRGGRTECFWVGHREDGPFYYLDVNNMYGWVLANHEFPAGLYGVSDRIDPYRLAYKLERYAVIADVTVEVDQPAYPYLLDQHSCYPLGSFRTTLTTPEIMLAIDRSWLREVHTVAWYRKGPLFQDYVWEFSQLREHYEQQGEWGMREIAKRLVNHLYGKFGQRRSFQEIIGECDPTIVKHEKVYCEETDEVWDQVWLGGYIYRIRYEGESFHSFPAIAAHVTAHARLRIWEISQMVDPEHRFYTDTDSIVVDQLGFKQLVNELDPNKLGALKVEQVSPWLEIHAPKDYAMEGRFKLKGVSSKAKRLAPGVYEQTHWPKLAGMIRSEQSQGYVTRKVVKNLKRVVHSGVVGPRGWVQPFLLEQGKPVGSALLPQLLAPSQLPSS